MFYRNTRLRYNAGTVVHYYLLFILKYIQYILDKPTVRQSKALRSLKSDTGDKISSISIHNVRDLRELILVVEAQIELRPQNNTTTTYV